MTINLKKSRNSVSQIEGKRKRLSNKIAKSLVPNWKKMHKSWTIILSVVFALANLIMGGLFILSPIIDVKTFAVINFAFYLIVGIGRMFKQESLEHVEPPSRYEIMPYGQTREEELRISKFDNPDL